MAATSKQTRVQSYKTREMIWPTLDNASSANRILWFIYVMDTLITNRLKSSIME